MISVTKAKEQAKGQAIYEITATDDTDEVSAPFDHQLGADAQIQFARPATTDPVRQAAYDASSWRVANMGEDQISIRKHAAKGSGAKDGSQALLFITAAPKEEAPRAASKPLETAQAVQSPGVIIPPAPADLNAALLVKLGVLPTPEKYAAAGYKADSYDSFIATRLAELRAHAAEG